MIKAMYSHYYIYKIFKTSKTSSNTLSGSAPPMRLVLLGNLDGFREKLSLIIVCGDSKL